MSAPTLDHPALPAGLTVVGELGAGAQTVVLRVRDDDGREYAYKTVRDTVAPDDVIRARFRREAAWLARVSGEVVPQAYDMGELDGRPYLVSELVDGVTLTKVLRAGGLTEQQVADIGAEVAAALTAVHAAGYVHQDVKSDNIIVDRTGHAQLIDFDLVRTAGFVVDDTVTGTVEYCAPESLGALRRSVDGRSDLYSLGVVLYECLAGELPFHSDDPAEIIQAHASTPAPAPPAGPALAEVLNRLLAKDPEDRYADAAALVAALVPLGSPRAAQAAEAMTRPAGLIGRDTDTVRLLSHWHPARAGQVRSVLVIGPAGVGKSSVAAGLADGIRAERIPVLHGSCAGPETMPFSALRTAIDDHLRFVRALPSADRRAATDRLRAAAGEGASLLRALSPSLALLLDVAPAPGDDHQERFVEAVIAFLADLAVASRGLLIWLDDAESADDGSLAVLTRLSAQRGDAPVLVVGTARTDVERLTPCFTARLGIDPLDADAVRQLLAAALPGAEITDELAAPLVARVHGNPLAVAEYVRAVVDAGALRPVRGTWRLDEELLAGLDLPADVLDLVGRRLDALPAETRSILGAAAVLGARFRVDLLDAVAPARVPARSLLAPAAAAGLVQTADDDTYAFVHERVRAWVLDGLDPADRRSLHQRAAESLARAADPDSAARYVLAGHVMEGEPDRDPEAAYRACRDAGLLALTEHAPQDAVRFFEYGASAAQAANRLPDTGFHGGIADAYARTGRFDAAESWLRKGIEATSDTTARAALLARLATVYHLCWDADRSLDAVRDGLAEIGHRLPGRRAALALTSLLFYVAGRVTGAVDRRVSDDRPELRERYRLTAQLLDIGGQAAAMGSDQLGMTLLGMRARYAVQRLGGGYEYARAMAGVGILQRVMGMRRASERTFDRSARYATDAGDLALLAHVEWMRALAAGVNGAGDCESEHLGGALDRHGPWNELGEYLTGIGTVGARLVLAGHMREAGQWYERGASRRGEETHDSAGTSFDMLAVTVAALRGDLREAARRLAELGERPVAEANLGGRLNLLGATARLQIEEREFDAPFDATMDKFRDLGLAHWQVWGVQRELWILQAYGRLAQLRAATTATAAAGRPARLEQARAAVRALGRAATDPVQKGHLHVVRAQLHLAQDSPERALTEADRADVLAARFDAPLVAFEAARVRAQTLRHLGRAAAALAQARGALGIALEQGWPHRGRWIREEFRELDSGSRSSRTGLNVPSPTHLASYARRLEALQQISLSAGTVLDTGELARTALDETIRILGAERGFLFLLQDDGTLTMAAGRAADHGDIASPNAYGASLVQRVLSTGEALVVAGGEQAIALGSRSAVVHGLRSIMVAPMESNGRRWGVVYLDSRIARGIFTDDDVDTLRALVTHVATALELGRAAGLEATVLAASAERDLAETLRASLADINATTDPAGALGCLLESVTRVVSADAAYHLLDARDIPGLGSLAGPVSGSDDATAREFAAAFDRPVCSWLAVPIGGDDTPTGLVVAVSEHATAFTDGQREIAAALVAQGATAYERALLFERVQQMATMDALSGVPNRRHLMDLAHQLTAVAARTGRPMAVIMADIDYFKQVNDNHGHHVGDQVITAVAQRFAGEVRACDIVGRYGGEEFVVVLPEVTAGAPAGAERLRAAVADAPIALTGGQELSVTVSLGLAYLAPGESFEDLLARADAKLYEAKKGGRNRVVVDESGAPA